MEKDEGSQGGLPCPFCGYLFTSIEQRFGYSRGERNKETDFAVVCHRCGASGPAEVTLNRAILSWNTVNCR